MDTLIHNFSLKYNKTNQSYVDRFYKKSVPNLDKMSFQDLVKIIKENQSMNWIPNKSTFYTLVFIYSLMIIIAFLLNLLILIVVLISKNLHKPNILLSLNLIIANITSAIICMPFTMNSIILKLWTFGEFFCKLVPFLQSVTVFVSSTTVTIITMNRYFTITSLKQNNPKLLEFLSICSKYKLLSTLIIWLVAFLLSFPILIYQQLVTVGIENVYTYKVCLEHWPETMRIIYTILTFTLAFILPIYTLCHFHYRIGCYLNKNLKKSQIIKDKLTKSVKVKKNNLDYEESQSFILPKQNSNLNYISLIDLSLVNSSDLRSSSTITKEFKNFNDINSSRNNSFYGEKKKTKIENKLSINYLNKKEKIFLEKPYYQEIINTKYRYDLDKKRKKSSFKRKKNKINSFYLNRSSSDSNLNNVIYNQNLKNSLSLQEHLFSNSKQIYKIKMKYNSTNTKRNTQIKLANFKLNYFTCFINRLKRFNNINSELRRNQKITFILALGIIVFTISWLPLNIYNLYIDFNYVETTLPVNKLYLIFSICHIFAMSSSISNAILYGLLDTNIQKELTSLLKKCINSNK